MSEEGGLMDRLSLVEACIFASAEPVSGRALLSFLASQGHHVDVGELHDIVEALQKRLEGHAFELCAVAQGWQFRTRLEFAPALTKMIEKPRRLSRGAMETLAIVAYHQPCTRADIETIRGVTLGQNILDTLLEEELLMPKGRREVPGRPVLWGTTPNFLRIFGLNALSDLPKKEELVLDPALLDERDDDIMQGKGKAG
ncbi:SMC-Scp complex subunit ScpB [Acetobacteraceae bacterium ESL0709]|nr:SMC-Scp complex subunit ScpB [Acetobacteraceae bacterium ESL0697]MDF7677681.1 SMC-Scp complex subunit ScpB [Acetobacteraceae bacterium ESL0709]